MDLEAVLQALFEISLHDPEAYIAADANELVEIGENYNNFYDFMEALSPTQKKVVMRAVHEITPK
jgi:hypothetical protein